MNSDFLRNRENLVTTECRFFKSHPDLEVLSVDDIFATLEEFVGHDIKGLKTLFSFLNTQK
jgi:hypothetical protein